MLGAKRVFASVAFGSVLLVALSAHAQYSSNVEGFVLDPSGAAVASARAPRWRGADGEVMIGAAATIRRCRPVIVFEWETLLSRHFSVSSKA